MKKAYRDVGANTVISGKCDIRIFSASVGLAACYFPPSSLSNQHYFFDHRLRYPSQTKARQIHA